MGKPLWCPLLVVILAHVPNPSLACSLGQAGAPRSMSRAGGRFKVRIKKGQVAAAEQGSDVLQDGGAILTGTRVQPGIAWAQGVVLW